MAEIINSSTLSFLPKHRVNSVFQEVVTNWPGLVHMLKLVCHPLISPKEIFGCCCLLTSIMLEGLFWPVSTVLVFYSERLIAQGLLDISSVTCIVLGIKATGWTRDALWPQGLRKPHYFKVMLQGSSKRMVREHSEGILIPNWLARDHRRLPGKMIPGAFLEDNPPWLFKDSFQSSSPIE